MSTIQTLLGEKIHASADGMINFCQHLLQTPSVNGVHDEIGVVRVIVEQAEKLGLDVTVVGADPARPNVIISTAPDRKTGMIFVGHTDTVPTGDENQWTHPPFSGELVDGKIYGRGAVDTKGGIAAALYALAALQRVPESLPHGRAQLICVPDEETGATGTLGIKHLHSIGMLNGKGAIYAYSGDIIHIGHRGLIRFKVTCKGVAEHTGSLEWQEKTRGASAVMGMADLLLRIEAETFPYSDVPYFERFRTMITPGSVIEGGASVNIVPDFCEALFDVRTTPGFEMEKIESILKQHIADVQANRPDLEFSVAWLTHLPAVISDVDEPIFKALSDANDALTGHVPEMAVAGPANEGYLLVERGIPTVCGFGPQGENFHGIDEYVDAASLVETAHIFALAAHYLDAHVT